MPAGFVPPCVRPQHRPRRLRPHRQRLAALDAFIRQPLVPLAAATICGLVIFVAATQRALPLLGGLLATILIGTASPWLAVVGLRGRGRFDRSRCHVGDVVQATIMLSGHAARWIDETALDWPDAHVAAGSRSGRELQVRLVPTARGRFPRRPPRVSTSRPFGLITASRGIPFQGSVIVRPRTTPIRFPASLVAPRRHGHEPSDGVAGGCGDILGSRDYRPGDSVRQIHWPQTARRDSLVVCERPGNGSPTVRLLLDLQLEALPPVEASAVLEALVVIASSVVEHWAARGVCFEVVLPDGPHRVRDPRGLDRTLDQLACLELPARPPAASRPSMLARADWTTVLGGGCDLELVIGPAASIERRLAAGSGRRRQAGSAMLGIGLETSLHARSSRIRPHATVSERLILLPATPTAAALLDERLAEIGHDPDAWRR